MSQPNNVSAAGDDDLAQMTPNQKRALSKALSALETMAALWASEIRLTDMAKRIADVPDAAERVKRIAAFVEQGFIEGAYRHYIDHKDQIEALAASSGKPRDACVHDNFSTRVCEYGTRGCIAEHAAPAPAAREAGDGVTLTETTLEKLYWTAMNNAADILKFMDEARELLREAGSR